MNYLDFITEITNAIAWPIATVIIVLKLHPEIGCLLSRIKRIKHRDSEIDLGQEVSEAKLTADNLPEFVDKSKIEMFRLKQLAKDSPRGAILEAWLNVDEAMTKYCERHGIEGNNINLPSSVKINAITMTNLDQGTLGSGVIDMLVKLSRIRNEAVHIKDSEITFETAIEYAALAARVTAKIEEA